ncbi:MAG: type II toxin-antitoxin system VapC family toxin [Chthoniobacteraceae bacterium]
MVGVPEFVIDASVALAWAFADESSAISRSTFTSLLSGAATAHVPALWPIEMVNVLLRGPRNGTKLSDSDLHEFFEGLMQMSLKVHPQSLGTLAKDAPRIMKKHALSAYDTAYLLLAASKGLPLATHDRKLQQAALAEGVTILE